MKVEQMGFFSLAALLLWSALFMLQVCPQSLAVAPGSSNTAVPSTISSFGASSQQWSLYKNWKDIYGLQYNDNEDQYRIFIFFDNLNKIETHNSNLSSSYKLRLNQFSSMTNAEFAQTHLTVRAPDLKKHLQYVRKIQNPEVSISYTPLDVARRPLDSTVVPSETFPTAPAETFPTPSYFSTVLPDVTTPTIRSPLNRLLMYKSIDWRDSGKVSEVVDQGVCGSCYAITAVGAIESAFLIERNLKLNLSSQQLVDCSIFMGNFACLGGWVDYAFTYVIYYSLTTAEAYPYMDDQGSCKRVGGEYRINGYQYSKVEEGCEGIRRQLETRPVAVSVDALRWQFYGKGLFNNCVPDVYEVNHAVLLVGQDESGHWLIKNSWGLTWGDKGYMTLLSGPNCGICLYPGAIPLL